MYTSHKQQLLLNSHHASFLHQCSSFQFKRVQVVHTTSPSKTTILRAGKATTFETLGDATRPDGPRGKTPFIVMDGRAVQLRKEARRLSCVWPTDRSELDGDGESQTKNSASTPTRPAREKEKATAGAGKLTPTTTQTKCGHCQKVSQFLY